jgi:hypothetical protein
LQTEAIAAGSILRASDQGPLDDFTASFHYAALRLRVADTNPASGSIIDIPFTGTFTVDLNTPVDPATVANSNLTLSKGTVTGFSVSQGGMSIAYTLSGLNQEGPLTVTIPEGTYGDLFGNPGAAFTGSYTLHYNGFPLRVTAVNPRGSLVYDASGTGTIAAADQADSFTVPLLAGQTLTLLVNPTGTTLQPAVQVLDPDNNLIATVTAQAAGGLALLNTIAIPTDGVYTIVVSGAGGTTGGYRGQAYLDAALEEARYGGPPDTSRATAQDLEPAFAGLPKGAGAAAVLGQTLPGGGYAVAAVTPTFEDISATGTPTLLGVDDGYTSVGPAQLAGFTFPFYGHTYSTVYFSSNGLISFGAGDSTLSTSDLTSSPPEACIAVFLEDLYVTGASDSAVLWQVLGTGANQRLVIQWNDISFYRDGSRHGGLTFEAELYANGAIQLNYVTLSTSGTHDEGQSSTVGIKDAGTQGPNRLLLDNRGAPATYSQYVGSHLSTLIMPVAPGSEYYAFHLDAGQHVSLAVTALGPGQVTEQLEDAGGNVLASGTAFGGGAGQAINNFTAPAAGTYYVVVGGGSQVSYNLVVTRDSVFDLGGNGTLATAQDMDGTAGALGYLATGSSVEWYRFTAADGQNLSLATYTPGDSGAAFVNPLAPHIQLYSADGTLVASGVVGNDGRNELITYTIPPGAGGTYYLRIVSANGQPGEFFLDPEETPATLAVTAPTAPEPLARTVFFSGHESNFGRMALLSRQGGSGEPSYGTTLAAPVTEGTAGAETAALDQVFATNPLVGMEPDLREQHPAGAVWATAGLGDGAEDLPDNMANMLR